MTSRKLRIWASGCSHVSYDKANGRESLGDAIRQVERDMDWDFGINVGDFSAAFGLPTNEEGEKKSSGSSAPSAVIRGKPFIPCAATTTETRRTKRKPFLVPQIYRSHGRKHRNLGCGCRPHALPRHGHVRAIPLRRRQHPDPDDERRQRNGPGEGARRTGRQSRRCRHPGNLRLVGGPDRSQTTGTRSSLPRITTFSTKPPSRRATGKA